MTFLLHDYKEFDVPEKVGLGDGRIVDAVSASKRSRMCTRYSTCPNWHAIYFQSDLQYRKETS